MDNKSSSTYLLAQQGDPNAIAQLLRKSLAAGGVSIQNCDRKAQTIRVLLVGGKIDQQQATVIDFLKKSLQQLEIQSIEKVQVYGQKLGEAVPSWTEEFLMTENPLTFPDLHTQVTSKAEIEEEQGDNDDLPPSIPQSSSTNSSRPKTTKSLNATTQKTIRKPPRPPDRLWMAILSLLLFFPLGIFAVIQSSEINVKFDEGNYSGAKSSSDLVKTFFIIILSIVGLPIAIGMMMVVLLPFSNQANEARESEGKQYVGSMNRAQQAVFLENSDFSDNINDLGLGIASETANYIYEIEISGSDSTITTAIPKQPGLLAFVGGVFLVNTDGDKTTEAILCETLKPLSRQPAFPYLVDNEPKCSAGTKEVD